MAYIEENMKLRRGKKDEDEEGASKPANAQDDLYRMMEQFKAQGGKKAEEGNVTNSLAMLTAIPEVDLGMECVFLCRIDVGWKASGRCFEV